MSDAYERQENGFTVSTDPEKLDARAIHAYLSNDSYWAANIPLAVVERGLENSLCFGLYQGERQIGLARVVTDYATFAWLCDVYVVPTHQGHGLGKFLIRCAMEYLQPLDMRRIMLRTRDAHGLYRQFGFVEATLAETWMEVVKRPAYPVSS